MVDARSGIVFLVVVVARMDGSLAYTVPSRRERCKSTVGVVGGRGVFVAGEDGGGGCGCEDGGGRDDRVRTGGRGTGPVKIVGIVGREERGRTRRGVGLREEADLAALVAALRMDPGSSAQENL